MKKVPLILLGAGGHCKSVIDIIEHLREWEIGGIVGMPDEVGTKILGYPVIGSDEDLKEIARQYRNFHISIGFISSPEKRIGLWNKLLTYGVNMPSLVSPLAYVSNHAEIGSGTIIMHGAVINAAAVIGENVIINTKALVEHDAEVGSHSHIATGAIINGGVVVGSGSFIGSGAVTRQGVIIPERSFIKANTIVK